MLIWINGCHGAGKSSVANQIRSLRSSARIIDPEQIGFMLQRMLPREVPDDFKDLQVWREMTGSLLAAAAGSSQELVVVPMTITIPAHLDEIVRVLSDKDIQICHFTLTASPDTLRKRLRWRLDWPSSRRWALSRVEDSVLALQNERFAMHLPSDEASPATLAARVLGGAGA